MRFLFSSLYDLGRKVIIECRDAVHALYTAVTTANVFMPVTGRAEGGFD